MSFASASENIIKEVDLLTKASQELFEKEEYEKGFEKLDMAEALCNTLEENYDIIKIDPLMIYGIICQEAEKHEEALEYFEKANKKLKLVAKPPFDESLYVLKGLETSYESMENRRKLIETWEGFYGLFASHFSISHEKTVAVMRLLLYAYVNEGIKEKALRLAKDMIRAAGEKPELIKADELENIKNILQQSENL